MIGGHLAKSVAPKANVKKSDVYHILDMFFYLPSFLIKHNTFHNGGGGNGFEWNLEVA